MIHSPQFKVVLDANVLYPAPVRDLLLNLADLDIFTPKWSEIIQEEWIRNLLKNRPDLNRSRLLRTVNLMNSAFPDAEVHGFEDLIDELTLPDINDRHVLAVAIKSNSEGIITFNKKDFPDEYLDEFNIKPHTPDSFLNLLNKFNPPSVQKAFVNQMKSLKNPPITKKELINTLVNCNIKSAKNIF